MRKQIMWTLVAALFFCPTVKAQQATKREVETVISETDKQILLARIDRIMEKDQQFRTYLAFGTIEENKIAEFQKRDAKGQLAAMSQGKESLSKEITDLLGELQRRNDRENHVAFKEIVDEFGYPSPERLGVKSHGLFAILLHPPVALAEIESHTREMQELLLPEAMAGRMKPQLYASFVDNMRAKILRLPQLYGTNHQFDSVSGKVRPPIIEDLQNANAARREIGMPELKDGDYRIAETNSCR
jgi:hypothetical protein